MLDITVNADHQIAFVQLSGSLTGIDISQSVRELCSHPDWQPGYSVIWDWSGITALEVVPEHVTAAVDMQAELGCRMGTGRSAIVTSRDIDATVARLLVLRTTKLDRERRVFTSKSAAIEWLKSTPAQP